MTDTEDSPLVKRAASIAAIAHKNQLRKYTGEPYFVHLEEVAGIVKSVRGHDEMIATAYLHDILEDTDTNPELLEVAFGKTVRRMVELLTDTPLSAGNRATRKTLDRERLYGACGEIKTIKLADLISNSKSIVMHDPKFAKVYLAEKALMLDVLVGGNEELLVQAKNLLAMGLATLSEMERSKNRSWYPG